MMDSNEIFFVGERNIQMADTILNLYQIKVIGRDVGGPRGRRLSFQTHKGQAIISLIPDSTNESF